MFHGAIRNTQSTEEGSRSVSIGYPRGSRGLLLGITSRITPRNKNLYDLTSLSIHFIPPASPTSISYVYNNGVTATASTSCVLRLPSPGLVSFCEIIYDRKGELWDTIVSTQPGPSLDFHLRPQNLRIFFSFFWNCCKFFNCRNIFFSI